APSTGEVRRSLAAMNESDEVGGVRILSLEPESLEDVAETFVEVADACGVPERGVRMRDDFLNSLRTLQDAIGARRQRRNGGRAARPRMVVLEWLDPPYDGGHWIPQLIDAAGCDFVKIQRKDRPHADDSGGANWNGTKSKQITWDDVCAADPDVVLVACCGFDLERNLRDARKASGELGKLRAARENRVFAANGDKYFARPGPLLVEGARIAARCALEGVPGSEPLIASVEAMDDSAKRGEGWDVASLVGPVTDIEDAHASQRECWSALHQSACEAGEMHYVDPETGYQVFTELAHKRRGKCCGSGCRHCPYAHENVRSDVKAEKIQQPAFLHERSDGRPFALSSDETPGRVTILFFSGGKDS
ncbi:hypothetical protein ACHAWF_008127, partial [Thalassiosira exigua]